MVRIGMCELGRGEFIWCESVICVNAIVMNVNRVNAIMANVIWANAIRPYGEYNLSDCHFVGLFSI